MFIVETKIQAVMFNEVVDNFDETFTKENTYTIANGVVKEIYPSQLFKIFIDTTIM